MFGSIKIDKWLCSLSSRPGIHTDLMVLSIADLNSSVELHAHQVCGNEWRIIMSGHFLRCDDASLDRLISRFTNDDEASLNRIKILLANKRLLKS